MMTPVKALSDCPGVADPIPSIGLYLTDVLWATPGNVFYSKMEVASSKAESVISRDLRGLSRFNL